MLASHRDINSHSGTVAHISLLFMSEPILIDSKFTGFEIMNPLSKKKLQAIGLVNSRTIAVAAKNRIYIEHRKGESVLPAKWIVCGINFKTDPAAAWYDHGCMAFTGRSKDDEARQKAIAWASTEYLTGETSWEKDPFGGWHPYGTIARAVAAKEDT